MGGLTHVRNRAPFLGGTSPFPSINSLLGSFAMWGGVFSSMDCLLIYYRQKDDPYNAIAAGFITGGVLAIRGIHIIYMCIDLVIGGASVAFKNAMVGGIILALIEGVSTIVTSVAMRR
jgi:import inner membrane translocase subunit TIM17